MRKRQPDQGRVLPGATGSDKPPDSKRGVRFAPGPLADKYRSHDGHPDHEGRVARPMRSLGISWGHDLTPSSIKELETQLGEECRPSLDRLKRRVGLLPLRKRPQEYLTWMLDSSSSEGEEGEGEPPTAKKRKLQHKRERPPAAAALRPWAQRPSTAALSAGPAASQQQQQQVEGQGLAGGGQPAGERQLLGCPKCRYSKNGCAKCRVRTAALAAGRPLLAAAKAGVGPAQEGGAVVAGGAVSALGGRKPRLRTEGAGAAPTERPNKLRALLAWPQQQHSKPPGALAAAPQHSAAGGLPAAAAALPALAVTFNRKAAKQAPSPGLGQAAISHGGEAQAAPAPALGPPAPAGAGPLAAAPLGAASSGTGAGQKRNRRLGSLGDPLAKPRTGLAGFGGGAFRDPS